MSNNLPTFANPTKYETGDVIGSDEGEKTSETNKGLIKIGILACKGVVGKTTLAAHLAGIFVLRDLDTAIIDLDPEKNLTKLMSQEKEDEKQTGINTRDFNGNMRSIEVFDDKKDFETFGDKNTKMLIVDCSPGFDKNNHELLAELDLVIIPTTLNPMGLSRGGDVITRTVVEIRKVNQNC